MHVYKLAGYLAVSLLWLMSPGAQAQPQREPQQSTASGEPSQDSEPAQSGEPNSNSEPNQRNQDGEPNRDSGPKRPNHDRAPNQPNQDSAPNQPNRRDYHGAPSPDSDRDAQPRGEMTESSEAESDKPLDQQSNEAQATPRLLLTDENQPWSDGIPRERKQQARALFLEATDLVKAKLFALGVVKFEEAIAVWDHPAIHYNLALAQLNLDRPTEAYESLKRAMRHGPDAIGLEKYKQAHKYRKLLDEQLTPLEVVCDEVGAQVTLNGKPLFTGPGHYRGRVRSGGYQLVAIKAGRLPTTQQIVLIPGEEARFSLTLRYPPSTTIERYWAAWIPWVVVGAGAAGLLSAGYVDWQAYTELQRIDADFEDFYRSNCPVGQNSCSELDLPQPLQERRRRVEAEQKTAILMYVAGGTVAATGALLAYINRERLVLRAGRDESTASLIPLLAPQVAGVSAQFHF